MGRIKGGGFVGLPSGPIQYATRRSGDDEKFPQADSGPATFSVGLWFWLSSVGTASSPVMYAPPISQNWGRHPKQDDCRHTTPPHDENEYRVVGGAGSNLEAAGSSVRLQRPQFCAQNPRNTRRRDLDGPLRPPCFTDFSILHSDVN